ncbi:hypothetical protein KAOT1_04937 [Kordia algicida OT-1]|uniref:Uncharacterized protein n=1 Tax=Kordia algicida OT-1 TaxID=391587 RepID=A9DZC1_9FLAO|nr:hypothetical protein KAOT1_04937 [Kordia algicida OT-1]
MSCKFNVQPPFCLVFAIGITIAKLSKKHITKRYEF